MITVGIGTLIGAALGLRFKVFVLFPTVILALAGTAAVGMARAGPMGSVALAMVLAAAALQIGYFAGSIARAAAAGLVLGGAEFLESRSTR